MILLALALQAAAGGAPPPARSAPTVPQRFSILRPDCRTPTDRDDIVICTRDPMGQRLPLPDERAPPDGRGANPDLSAARALALQATPCAATQRGCTVGFGPPIVPIAKALVGAAKSAFARKPDKRGRIAIPLD